MPLYNTPIFARTGDQMLIDHVYRTSSVGYGAWRRPLRDIPIPLEPLGNKGCYKVLRAKVGFGIKGLGQRKNIQSQRLY